MLDSYNLTLLIPYYNDPKGLYESLSSLGYSNNILIVIVNDGSSINFKESEIRKALSDTPNYELHILNHKQNMGVRKALNTGLYFIKNQLQTDYIARLDCGDLCIYDRLNKQVEFLQKHQDVGIVGSNVLFKHKDENRQFRFKAPETNDEINKKMNAFCCFIHPSVMFRSEVLNKIRFYPTQFDHAEDYAFFREILKSFKGANIQEYLTVTEINQKGVSLKNRKRQLESRLKVMFNYRSSNLFFVYGIMRTLALYITPYALIENLKMKRF